MPGKINRIPQGFLSLLDLKAAGRNADELSPTLISTLEAIDFYVATLATYVTGTVAAPSIGQNGQNTLTPPAGFVWLVRRFSAFSNADIAAAATLEIACGIVPGASGVFLGSGPVSGGKTTAQRAVSGSGRPFLMQPGDQLGFFASVLTGAPGTVPVSAYVAALSV